MWKQSHHPRAAIVAPTFAFFLLALLLPRTGATHEPITTKVMFNKEVIRILARNCLACHAPGKIKSDILLTTYEEARPWAKAIKEEVLEKRMVPFQAVKGYGSFVHDYTLPQRDVELLVSWIEGGAPRGDAKDYPKEEIEKLVAGKEWPLGQPDLILQPDKEVKIAAEGDDETRCFVLPTNLKEDRWINAIDFQPGAGAVVHSANMFVVPPSGGKAPAKAGTTNNCAPNAERIGQWAPGQSASRMPEGAAIKLPANSRVVAQIRYRKNGESVTDRSSVGLYFAKGPVSKLVRNVAVNAPGAVIPPNAENHRVKTSYTTTEPTDVVAIRPLLFPFAKSVEAVAYRPDGSVEVLIWAKDYRFDWQPAYFFKKPVTLPRGARIEVTAYLDDSEDNRAEARLTAALCELSLTSASPGAPVKQARR
jgi:hypothetical protein